MFSVFLGLIGCSVETVSTCGYHFDHDAGRSARRRDRAIYAAAIVEQLVVLLAVDARARFAERAGYTHGLQ